MIGVSAPSSADSLLALAKFVQSPELQARLEELREAESKATAAREETEQKLKELEEVTAKVAAEQKELDGLKKRLEGLPEKEAALEARIKEQAEAHAERSAALNVKEAEFRKGQRDLARSRMQAWQEAHERTAALELKERELEERKKTHEEDKTRHEEWLGKLQKVLEERNGDGN